MSEPENTEMEENKERNHANFTAVAAGALYAVLTMIIVSVIGFTAELPPHAVQSMMTIGALLAYLICDARAILEPISVARKELKERKKAYDPTDSGFLQPRKRIPAGLWAGIIIPLIIIVGMVALAPFEFYWWVPVPLVGWLLGSAAAALLALSTASVSRACELKGYKKSNSHRKYSLGSSVLKLSSGIRRNGMAAVYACLIIGIIIFIKAWIGLSGLPLVSSWYLMNFMTTDLFSVSAIIQYTTIFIVMFFVLRYDWGAWRDRVADHTDKIAKLSWKFGLKLLILPVGIITLSLFLYLPIKIISPAAFCSMFVVGSILAALTLMYQNGFRALGQMVSIWLFVKFHTVYYRGVAVKKFWNQTNKTRLLGAVVLFTCNISPLLIECFWNPSVSNYLRSNDHANDLLSAGGVPMSPWGGPTWMFLEKNSSSIVVNESNGWLSYLYNGQQTWGRGFSGLGASYVIVDIEGITGANITLVHPDEGFYRLNYSCILGRNEFSIYLGEELYDWHIEVADYAKSYFSRIVIVPLFSVEWTDIELEWSKDHNGDDLLTADDAAYDPDAYHPETVNFFAFDMVTILIKPYGSAHNSLYITVDDVLVQSLHETPEYPMVTTNLLVESEDKYAYEYELRMDNMNWNASCKGQHQMVFAIAENYSNTVLCGENISVSYAIIKQGDWDYDSISDVLETNVYYDLLDGPEVCDNWGTFSIYPEGESTEVFESNWSFAQFDFTYRGIYPSYLYIDIVGNTSVFTNITVDNVPICHGIMEGIELNFTASSLYSIYTEMLLTPGDHSIGFLYHTASINPAMSLMFWINGWTIAKLPGDSTFLSRQYVDSDGDDLPDEIDLSPNRFWLADADSILRILAETQTESDTELTLQFSVPEDNLYAKTHNSSGVYTQWNDGTIITIDPVLRIFSDLYKTQDWAGQTITSGGRSFYMNTNYNPFVYPVLHRLNTIQEFSGYWGKDIQLVDARNPDTLTDYNLSVFGDSIVSDWDGDGVGDSSPQDEWGITPQAWFDNYTAYHTSDADYWFEQEKLRKEFIDFCDTRIGSDGFEGTIIEMEPTSKSFKATIIVPANHTGKENEILDIKTELLWRVTDLNIFGESIMEYGKSIVNSSIPTVRNYMKVTFMDVQTGDVEIENATYNYINSVWMKNQTLTETLAFNLQNATLSIPKQYEVENTIRFDEYYVGYINHSYNPTPTYYPNSYADDTYSDWKAYSNTFGSIDDAILGMNYGAFHTMANLTGKLLPPGTKIYIQGAPKTLTFYPWEDETVIIQSMRKVEHEQVQYFLGACDSAVEREIMNNLIKSSALWDEESSIFDDEHGGLTVSDDFYGTVKGIKNTTQLNLMTDALKDFEDETNFGCGWGQKRYPLDKFTGGYNPKIDNNLSYSDPYDRLWFGGYQDNDECLRMGYSNHTQQVWDEFGLYQYTINSSFYGSVGNSYSKYFTSGQITFDVIRDYGSLEFRLGNDSYTAFKITANDDSQWVIHDGNDFTYGTDASVLEWNHFTIFFNCENHLVDVFVNGNHVGQYYMKTHFIGANSFKFIGTDTVAALDNFEIPSWTQLGLQPTVLFTNSRYSTSDLLDYFYVNLYQGTYTGEMFVFNNTLFHLYYSAARNEFKLHYASDPFLLADDFSEFPFNNVTYSFNEDWMQGYGLPDFFSASESCSSGVSYGSLVMHAGTSGTTAITTDMSPMKSGTVKFDLNVTDTAQDFDAGTCLLASLNMKNFSVDGEGVLKVANLDKSIQIGSVGRMLSYRNTAITSSWTSTGISIANNQTYGITIRIYNSTTIGLGYRYDIIITYGQNTSQFLNNSLVFNEGNGFASFTFMAGSAYTLTADSLAFSSMLRMFNPLSSNWNYDSDSKVTVSEFILDINNTLSDPFLIVSGSSASREFHHGLASGLVEFSVAVTNENLTGSVILVCDTLSEDYIRFESVDGYWFLFVGEHDFNLSIQVVPYEFTSVRLLFGQSNLYGHTARDMVSVWIDGIFLDTYTCQIFPVPQGNVDTIKIVAESGQTVLFDDFFAGAVPDTYANNMYFDYQFTGYLHTSDPGDFRLWGQEYNLSLYWNAVFSTQNGSQFGYVNEFGIGTLFNNSIFANHTNLLQWSNESWGGFNVPVCQYLNASGQWETALRVLDLQYTNTSTVNTGKYFDSYPIAYSGTKIASINGTTQRMHINEFTPYIDWQVEDRYSPHYNQGTPYNSSYDTTFLLQDLIIKIPKAEGGFDIISSITNVSYYLNGVLQNGNICTSIYANLPVGTVILFRIDANDFAESFISTMAEAFSHAEETIDFDFRYGSEITLVSFESMVLSANVSNIEEFFGTSEFTESGVLYTIIQIEDYSEEAGIFKIPNLVITDFPVSVSISTATIKNGTRPEMLSLTLLEIVTVHSVSSLMHIAPSVNGGVDLAKVSPSNPQRSPFVAYRKTTIYGFTYSTEDTSITSRLRFGLLDFFTIQEDCNSNWLQIPEGNRVWTYGSISDLEKWLTVRFKGVQNPQEIIDSIKVLFEHTSKFLEAFGWLKGRKISQSINSAKLRIFNTVNDFRIRINSKSYTLAKYIGDVKGIHIFGVDLFRPEGGLTKIIKTASISKQVEKINELEELHNKILKYLQINAQKIRDHPTVVTKSKLSSYKNPRSVYCIDDSLVLGSEFNPTSNNIHHTPGNRGGGTKPDGSIAKKGESVLDFIYGFKPYNKDIPETALIALYNLHLGVVGNLLIINEDVHISTTQLACCGHNPISKSNIEMYLETKDFSSSIDDWMAACRDWYNPNINSGRNGRLIHHNGKDLNWNELQQYLSDRIKSGDNNMISLIKPFKKRYFGTDFVDENDCYLIYFAFRRHPELGAILLSGYNIDFWKSKGIILNTKIGNNELLITYGKLLFPIIKSNKIIEFKEIPLTVRFSIDNYDIMLKNGAKISNLGEITDVNLISSIKMKETYLQEYLRWREKRYPSKSEFDLTIFKSMINEYCNLLEDVKNELTKNLDEALKLITCDEFISATKLYPKTMISLERNFPELVDYIQNPNPMNLKKIADYVFLTDLNHVFPQNAFIFSKMFESLSTLTNDWVDGVKGVRNSIQSLPIAKDSYNIIQSATAPTTLAQSKQLNEYLSKSNEPGIGAPYGVKKSVKVSDLSDMIKEQMELDGFYIYLDGKRANPSDIISEGQSIQIVPRSSGDGIIPEVSMYEYSVYGSESLSLSYSAGLTKLSPISESTLSSLSSGANWKTKVFSNYADFKDSILKASLVDAVVSGGVENDDVMKMIASAIRYGGPDSSFDDFKANLKKMGCTAMDYRGYKKAGKMIDALYNGGEEFFLKYCEANGILADKPEVRKAWVKQLQTDLTDNKLAQGILKARADCIKEFAMEGIDILFEIFMWAMQQQELDYLLRCGQISEGDHMLQTLLNFAQMAFGIVVDILQIAMMIWSAAAEALSWVPVVNLILFIVNALIYLYSWLSNPINGQITNFRISDASPARGKSKYGAYRYNDTVRIEENYCNYDGLLIREHYNHIAARTTSMPMNVTPIAEQYGGISLYTIWMPEADDRYFYHTGQGYSYVCNGTIGPIAPNNWRAYTLDVPLLNISANEDLRIFQHYGRVDYLGMIQEDYQRELGMNLGAVVEQTLGQFLNNTNISCNLAQDIDGDGLSCQEEIAAGSYIRRYDSDDDGLSDYDEVTTYQTDPKNKDSDSDALYDGEEINLYGTNPLSPDTDNDGLGDCDEVVYYSNNSLADSDGDSLPDLLEYKIGTYANLTDSDDDGINDFTELRLNYDPMDADSPATTIAQTGFIGTDGLGFFKGQHTFSQYSSGTDPWSTSGSYGQAFVSLVPYKYKWLYPLNSSYHFSSEFGSYTPHYYSYVFNNSAGRAFYPSTSMGSDWQLEFYCAPMDNSFTTTIALSNYEEFRLRFNAANDKFEYKWGFHDWANISTPQTITNWTVWKIGWDLSEKALTWSIDLDSDESIDIQFELNASNCYWLQPALNYQFLSRVAFESGGTSVSAIDSVSIWTPMEEFNYDGYSKGDLYDVISFPDVFAWADTTSSKIRCEWAQIEGATMAFAYDDATFSGFESPDLMFAGPFSGATGALPIPSDGTWYIKPIAVMEDYYIPLGEAFPVEFTTYHSTYDFANDTLGQAPDLFTASGTATVEQARDVYKWYTNEPYTSYYKFCQLNDTGAASKSAIEKDVTRLISDNDFMEFWWATSNSTFTSEFIVTNADSIMLLTLSMEDGYFWLKSGYLTYNTTKACESDIWYQIRIVLSRSGIVQLYINSEFVDAFETDISVNKNVKKIKFATVNSDFNYTVAIRGIGLSWLGNYEKYENWPALRDVDIIEEVSGFTKSTSLSLVQNFTRLISTGEQYKDFVFLNDTTILINNGKVFDISGSEAVLTSTIHSWRQTKIFEGKLYVMADTKFEDFNPVWNWVYDQWGNPVTYYPEEYYPEGLHIYDISDPAHPEVIGEPYFWYTLNPYETHVVPYGPFDICRNGSQTLAFIATPDYIWGNNEYMQNYTYSFFLYDVTNPANIANPNHVNHTEIELRLFKQDSDLDWYWVYGGMRGESVKDVKIRTLDGNLVLYVVSRIEPYSRSWDDDTLCLTTFMYEPLGRYTHWYDEKRNNPTETGYFEMSRTRLADTELYKDPQGYFKLVPIRASINLPNDEFSSKVIVQMVGETASDATETRLIDIFNEEQTFKLGTSDLANSILRNASDSNLGDITEMIVSENDNTLSVYNASNPMSVDPNSALDTFTFANTVSSKLKWRDGGLWNVRTVYQSGQYITNVTQYEFDYPMDYASWQVTGAVNYVDYTGRFNTAQLFSNQQMVRSLEIAQVGLIQFQLSASNTTSGMIRFYNANATEGKYIDLTIAGFNVSTSFNNQYMLLSSGWNTLSLAYGSDEVTIASGSDSLVLNVTDGGWFTNVTFKCNANSGAMYLDAFQHKALVSDSDLDGIGDYQELNRYGTDPFLLDSDFDTISDGFEITYGLNPLEYNDAFLDLDEDGLLNVYEYGNGTKPNDWDTDRDGESDLSEILHNRNPLAYGFADSDYDGVSNAIEREMHTDPWSPDTDGDYANDSIELQLGLNPIIKDTDGDIMWDGWELQYGLDPDDADDADINGDADKISNVLEFQQGTNPIVSPDTDHDNIPDDWRYYWEESYDYGDPLGTNTSDHDADGVTNIQEFQGLWNGSSTWGTNPHYANVNWNLGVGISQDYCSFYDIPFTNDSANADADLDKLTNSMEWKARYNAKVTSLNPRSTSYNITMGEDWRSYYDISYTQTNLDPDQDKLKNYMEFRGKADAFSVSTRLDPRVGSSSYTQFKFKWKNDTEITRYFYIDWKTYYSNMTHPISNVSDVDGDKCLDWQEFYGYWTYTSTYTSTWGLNPKSKVLGYGMSQDWCTYWGITYSDAGSWQDADSDGVANRFEWGNNTNPRNSDTDGDKLPDKYELKWGLNALIFSGNDGKDGQADSDGLTNWQEYRFDISTLKMNPKGIDSDGDGHNDSKEFYLYWQYGNGIKHDGGAQISPIVANSNAIFIEKADPTGSYALHGTSIVGGSSYIDMTKTKNDGYYGWTWAYGTNTLDTYWEGYSGSAFLSNSTVRQFVSSVQIKYNLCPWTDGCTLSDFKMKLTTSTSTEDIWIYQGTLGSGQVSVWSDSYKITTSTTRNAVRAGNKVDRIRLYLTVSWNWACHGRIMNDYLGVRYCF